jgi:CHAT domain-containing protein
LVVGIRTTAAGDDEPLLSAVPEANWVATALGTNTQALIDSAATKGVVRTRLTTATWAHFACHASAARDPADSQLGLYDAPLPVRDVAELHLQRAHLAYLSACATAYGGVRLLDESIHVASAFQLAGFSHVIATMWLVKDPIAKRFAQWIYPQLIRGGDPAIAVHNAVRRMRDQLLEYPTLWGAYLHYGP